MSMDLSQISVRDEFELTLSECGACSVETVEPQQKSRPLTKLDRKLIVCTFTRHKFLGEPKLKIVLTKEAIGTIEQMA